MASVTHVGWAASLFTRAAAGDLVILAVALGAALLHTAADTVVDFFHQVTKENGFETSSVRTGPGQLWV
eukprot:gene48916-20261_t